MTIFSQKNQVSVLKKLAEKKLETAEKETRERGGSLERRIYDGTEY